jgi:hypothetical protein
MLICLRHTGLKEEDLHAMQLGLSHSLSRYKLKFSPDKVDTMIVQSICTLCVCSHLAVAATASTATSRESIHAQTCAHSGSRSIAG